MTKFHPTLTLLDPELVMVHGSLGDIIMALVVNTEAFSGLVPRLILSLSIVTLVALTFTLELLFMIVLLLDSMLTVSDFMLAPLELISTFELAVMVMLLLLSIVILLLSPDMVIPLALSIVIVFYCCY